MFFASEFGHVKVVKLLLDAKAEVNSKGDRGDTPLTWAAVRGHMEAVKLLVEAGADMEHKDAWGWYAVDVAWVEGKVEVVHFLQNQMGRLSRFFLPSFPRLYNQLLK